ncbi:hypothetical protein [Variovorax sp. WS11]|uniref:hypothetical protein n=1 Tax=Variovorax sp. WS11 TaxID=1105204 RepID=UPI0011B21F7E|nr:hypothetical protein [Variovorax sp. WS11]NDZ16772.1 hypothetical protein [Variovorax sp. WS11]
MAMSLFCYSSKSSPELQKIIDLIENQHQETFKIKFLFSKAQDVDPIQKETVQEYGFSANSFFLIDYNDNPAIGLSPTVVDLIKKSLGADGVLVLFENEELR